MQGYSAIVTGGAQGIGKAISAALIEAGMRVLLLDQDAEAGRETVEELSRDGQAVFMAGNAAREKDVRRAVAAAGRLGEGLYAAVANAGIADFKPLAQLSLRDWNRVLATNLTSCYLLARHAAPRLARNRGALLLISSTRSGMSEGDDEAYAASKGGICGLTQALAMSLGPQVRVNCISPGWILTDPWHKRSKRHAPRITARQHRFHPAGRAGKPEDIGALARFLISPQAGFITGADYVADGGMTRKMVYA